jgi:hypothetical protein
MAESHVVSGLVAKRSELSGLLAQHQETVRQLSAAIGNIDGAIKVFDPGYDLQTIRVRVPRQPNGIFDHGEAGRMVLDALRLASSPLSTRQIGEAMVASKGVTIATAPEWDAVMKLVIGAAKRMEKRGTVRMVGRVNNSGKGPMIWQLV